MERVRMVREDANYVLALRSSVKPCHSEAFLTVLPVG